MHRAPFKIPEIQVLLNDSSPGTSAVFYLENLWSIHVILTPWCLHGDRNFIYKPTDHRNQLSINSMVNIVQPIWENQGTFDFLAFSWFSIHNILKIRSPKREGKMMGWEHGLFWRSHMFW